MLLLPLAGIAQTEKFNAIVAGLAAYGGHTGIHAEAASGRQARNVDFGTYTSIISVSDQNFLRWTAIGFQIRGGPLDQKVNPYGLINYGLINTDLRNSGGLNLRNATIDLGGGIAVPLFGKFSFIADIRWKRYFDWKDDLAPFTIWTLNGGVKF